MNATMHASIRKRHRRGSAYLAIIGASTLVAIIGVSAVMVARVQLRASNLAADIDDARACARSGIELAKLWIAYDPNWRTNRPNGTWASNVALNGATLSIDGVDPNDNNLANWPTDPLKITVTATKGGATQIEQIMLVPQATPLSSLSAPLVADSNMTFNSANVTSDQTIAANGSVSAINGSKIDAPRIEAGSTISGATYYGTRATGVSTRAMPASTVFDSYIANATAINYSGLSGGKIENVVLSPASNPYGATLNPMGIYVVDCGGNRIRVTNCRIVGTLVILNPRNDSTVETSVNIAPAVANFPSLLVKGSMNFPYGNALLSENALGRNFNPPGTPYAGVSNTTMTDTFPSQISGLVYVSGNATFSGSTSTINGVFITDGSLAGGDMSITYDPTYLTNPPPGFCSTSPMLVSPGSWKQVVR